MALQRPVEERQREKRGSLQFAGMHEVVEHVLRITIPAGRTGFELAEGQNLLVRHAPRALHEGAQVQSAAQAVARVLHPAGGRIRGVRRRDDAHAGLAELAREAERVLLPHAVEVHPEDDLLDRLQQREQAQRERRGAVGEGDRGQPGGLVHGHGVELALGEHQARAGGGHRVPAEEAPVAARGLQPHVRLGVDRADLVAVHDGRGALQGDPRKHHAVFFAALAAGLHEGLRTRAHAVLPKRLRGEPAARGRARGERFPDAGEAVLAEIGDVLLHLVVGELVHLLRFGFGERRGGGRRVRILYV